MEAEANGNGKKRARAEGPGGGSPGRVVDGLIDFLNEAWTPFHATLEAKRMLLAAGYQQLSEVRLFPAAALLAAASPSHLGWFELASVIEPVQVV